jgi:MerR family transcriptional regulator, redox-sensitive transcriptional activator SoxR
MTTVSDELLPIGEVARRTGVAVSAIRYYESLGLVGPAARSAGRRRFAETTVGRLRVIATVQKAGFTLDEIRELLREIPGTQDRRHALVRSKLAEVQQDIQRLQAVATALEEALTCGCDSLEHCPLLPPRE